MLNQVVLVGRLTSDLEVKTTENGKQVSTICLAVSRSYRNEEGAYDSDFIDCVLWGNIAENTANFCKKGDMVGIKGRIQAGSYDDENGIRRKATEVVAEKVTFLSSKKED